MRLLPRTLLWRTFILLALLMVLSVIAWFAIYMAFEREPRARQTAQMVVSVVNLTRTALVTAQPDMRRDLLLDLSDREGIRIYPAEDEDKAAALPDRTPYRLIADEVRRQLGKDTRLSLDLNGMAGFWVSFHIADDEYWVMLPRDRLEQPPPAQWIGWASASVILSLAGAYLIVFGVTRPLQALAAGAAAIGRGDLPPVLSESGASEIATVSRTFNQMSRDLQQLDADRALILAGVSHDLRTPLARLRLNVEMSGADEATRQSMGEDIEDIDQVIGQFLDFARQTSGEPLQQVDIAALAADLAESYRRRGLPVEADLEPLLPLTARPRAIRRLMANLVDNALRYAGKEKPVELRARQTNGAVAIEVHDRGPGIPADQVERMKRPFTRLESARSNASGAGLGLAIVDRIARAHGGIFDLLPRPGGGLIARITLPDTAASAPPSPDAS
jgi:two-component system osmolarity sensor histidine kinase EnvZ